VKASRYLDTASKVHDSVLRQTYRVEMRDGVELAADVYTGRETPGPLPALLALSPYGKDHQALTLEMPPQRRPSPLWDGVIEAGDTRAILEHGYLHVIADMRGSGTSEGEHCGNYNMGGVPIGLDIYDLVEWTASQEWCDGNVGMVGISYFATVQVLGAAESPPHLRAIFCNGGMYDMYELAYHGGILWLMPRASREGRGGDSGMAESLVTSRTAAMLSNTELRRRVGERLEDPEIRTWPNMRHSLRYPKGHELWMDYLLNPHNGEFWKKGSPAEVAERVRIPAYFQIRWGRGWAVDSAIECFLAVKGPKRLDLQPMPPMQDRPFHENHDDMFRWYDHWLKGIDTGVQEEAPLRFFLEGRSAWIECHDTAWPLPETQWTEYFLRPNGKLTLEPEWLHEEFAVPDGFYQAPLTVTDRVVELSWMTDPLSYDMAMAGPGAMHVHVAIDTPDTNLITKIYDVAPSGSRTFVTSGYLKASHREVEPGSPPWAPKHPHSRSVPVPIGEVMEYPIRLYSFARVFARGHRIQVTLASTEAYKDSFNELLPPDSYHLPSGRATTHRVFRDREHRSCLLLPVIDPDELRAGGKASAATNIAEDKEGEIDV